MFTTGFEPRPPNPVALRIIVPELLLLNQNHFMDLPDVSTLVEFGRILPVLKSFLLLCVCVCFKITQCLF